MQEPKTSVTINDYTNGYGADPVDTRLNILCPIISPAGPTELTRVSGPSALRRLFFAGDTIKVSDHYSAVFDRAVVSNAPVYIKRGVRNNLKGGKTAFLGREFYTDSSLGIIRGVKATIGKASLASTYAEKVGALTGFLFGSTYYSNSLAESIFTDGLSDVATKVSGIPLKKTMAISQAATAPMIVTLESKQYTIPAGTSDFNSLLGELCEDGLNPQACYDSSGAFVKVTYKDGVLAIADNKKITKIGWVSNFTVVPSDTYAGLTVDSAPSSNIDMCKIYTESEYSANYKVSEVLVTVTADGSTYKFYTDKAPTSADTVVHLGDGLKYSEMYQKLVRALSSLFRADTSSNGIVIPGCDSVTISDKDNLLTVSTAVINEVQQTERFAVLSAFPCTRDCINVTVSRNTQFTDEVYTVSATYASGDISETWDISFDSGMVNGYGESLYYQRVNEESSIIRIVELYGESFTNQTFTIGSQVSSEYCGTEEIISAFEDMSETDEPDVFFDYITDGGVVDTSLSACIKKLCGKYHSFYPASVPTDVTLTEDNIKSRRTAIGNYFAMNLIANTQRGSYLDSGSAVYPASLYYLLRRIELGNSSLEFSPLFGQTNGNIGIQKPIQRFNKTTREDLLSVQVPTVKRESTGQYCLNLNLTCYPTPSYMQEDWVSLMINKINQVADIYAKTIISLPNTSRTRAIIATVLSDSLRGRLRVGDTYAPQAIRVQCDSSNNPQSLVDQRKVRIDIYATFANSIKEVLVYTNILPLNE